MCLLDRKTDSRGLTPLTPDQTISGSGKRERNDPTDRGPADQVEVFGDLAAGDLVVKIATDAIHSGDAVRVQGAGH